MKAACLHRLLTFWGSHSQKNGATCRKCGATWVHHRRYVRTKSGRTKTVSRLVLSPEAR